MLPLGEAEQSVYEIFSYYFLQLHVNLKLIHTSTKRIDFWCQVQLGSLSATLMAAQACNRGSPLSTPSPFPVSPGLAGDPPCWGIQQGWARAGMNARMHKWTHSTWGQRAMKTWAGRSSSLDLGAGRPLRKLRPHAWPETWVPFKRTLPSHQQHQGTQILYLPFPDTLQ